MRARLFLLARDERGASAVEYGLLLAAITGVIVAVIFLFGTNISSIFSDTCNNISTSSGVGPGC